MGYAEGIVCRMTFVDDVIVFALFLVVCSPPQKRSSSLNGQHRTGTYRCYIRPGFCMVSGITIYPCNTRSGFANPGAASYSATFHQEVNDVVD